MLRRLADLPILVILLALAGLAMLLPAAHATVLDDDRLARIFAQSAGLVLTGALMLALATAGQRTTVLQGYLAGLAAAYLALPVVFALPFVLALRDTTFANAWFEMVSCFTTTGATLYDSPDRLAPSLHLWRALVGWLGGFYTLAVAGAILPAMNLGGYEVITGRTPGRGNAGLSQITRTADPAERLARQAVTLFPPYAGITILLWIVLLLTGEDGLVALSHAMSTLSTSGISPGVDFEEVRAGFLGELAVFAFLCLALSRRFLPGPAILGRSPRIVDDPELRLAAVILAVVSTVLVLRHLYSVDIASGIPGVSEALRAWWGALFTALSFLTTTGFESSEWDVARDWLGTGSPGLVLAALAVIGGGVATTAGGVRLLRILALFRLGQRELEQVIFPSSVGGGGSDARRLRGEGAYAAWVFFMLFATSIGVVTAALTLAGVEFEPALVFGLSALTLTGPLAEVAGGVPFDWAALGLPAKAILAMAMIVGRLEILAVLALLSPALWRR
ncbi:TrkH family potassium uptake protein [Neotabrizicola shimadae]|uniref:TrkH family potassium uptake protein n=1 Tax=Neotabrizicola shimadae TaxID=2807096 RepID=A0A8G0ZXH9_9RHOB|nr:potassium transporter TrkG [Neotabrizicola shimadae]QYZ71255.1 TrkH family potassium uptake protein [Neotabrizicola shimadae]